MKKKQMEAYRLGLVVWGIFMFGIGCDTKESEDANKDSESTSDSMDGGTDADMVTDTYSEEIIAPWDWSGVVGTGQSLAVGDHGSSPESLDDVSTTQPYSNLKLSTGSLAWPVDPNDASLSMVPLVERVGRSASNYPSSWPTNISGETAHSAMGNQITALVKGAAGGDYISVQGEFGENGQCMTYLKKNATEDGVNGRAFEATLIETTAIARLAAAAGKTYGVGAIIVTHGECDAGNTGYETDLYQLWSDYNTDIRKITGQSETIQMIVSQQHSTNDSAASTLAQWKVGVDYPESIVCMGPKYQYPYASDGIHLVTDGYRQLGEKYGQVYFERVVHGNAWKPLQPIAATTSGRVITVQFHVPVLPLVFDTTLPAPNQSVPAWSTGEGFEVRQGSTAVTISSVKIVADTVQITCASDLTGTITVGYAMTAASGDTMQVTDPSNPGTALWNGTTRWGRLRDSDPFVGATTRKAQPNWSVAFEMTVP